MGGDFKEIHTFPLKLFENHKARNIAAWSRSVINEAGAESIGDAREDDSYSPVALRLRLLLGVPCGQDNVSCRQRFLFVFQSRLGISGVPVVVDLDATADESDHIGRNPENASDKGGRYSMIGRGIQQRGDHHTVTAGAVRGKRPYCRPAPPDQRDELAPVFARSPRRRSAWRCTGLGGLQRLAVLRLMTS